MRLYELVKGIDCRVPDEVKDVEITGVAHDSRQVKAGILFVAVKGANRDGRNFASEAVRRGAPAVVCEGSCGDVPAGMVVSVENPRKALAAMACSFYGRPSDRMRVIGITGTNGKTTTGRVVRDILIAEGKRPGVISTVAHEIGRRVIPAVRTTPEAPELQYLLSQMLENGSDSAVIEVSSHSLMQSRVAGIEFDAAVFTNLTRDHLDYHGSMENYFEAKKLLFRQLREEKKKGLSVVNADDPRGRRLAQDGELHNELFTFAVDREASVNAKDIVLGPQGSKFAVITPWGETKVKTALLGRFNISNILAAMCCTCALGIKPEKAAEAVSSMKPVPGRLEPVETGKRFDVFVDYAHTDDALARVLETLRELTRGRLILVFGCGGNRDKSKRPAMGKVASNLADYTVVTSDNPRNEEPSEIIAQILEGYGNRGNCEAIENRTEAISRALFMAQKGDVVLIAGKGHENFQEFANKTVSFDDRQAVRELTGGR
ncbi:MAG: UDP-N-acetylmuramoyl-L-alanyl-D-glutamate--2,6-diaminopimelate ligase [Kiritimatiellia bacterium]